MNEQAVAARRAYKRKWARENRDKVQAQQERYWTRKTAEAAAAEAQNRETTNNPSSMSAE